MINLYRRAMFFLTYVKGTKVNEWVMAVNRWLARQIQGGVNTADERLWNEVAASFTRCFADSLAKENAQSILRTGVKMKGEDIDGYIVKIEELIRLAEYRFDVPQTIEMFTDGLPTGLYQKILELDRPVTYEQWKQAAINRQQDYIHMKARLKAHRGGYTQRGRGGGITRDLREVECYTCRKKGHLSRNCPQHTWNQPNGERRRNWTPRPSQGREAIVDDRSAYEGDEEQPIVARSSTQTPQQQADSWLRGVATAGEDVQELVMRDLVGREGFQNA